MRLGDGRLQEAKAHAEAATQQHYFLLWAVEKRAAEQAQMLSRNECAWDLGEKEQKDE
jgi:hypothetical protein